MIVDAPKTDAKNLVPTVVGRTSKTAYVRFHGRNAATWNKRTGSAAERFDYLYSEEELEEWVEPLRELAGETESVYAMFNNNGRSAMPSTGPRGARAGGGRRRSGQGRGRAGARERADAEAPAG